MTKRFALLLCVLLSLAACGRGLGEEVRPTPINPAGGEGGGAADEGGGVGQTVSLRLWAPNDDARNAALQGLIVAYTTANPDVAIQLETFNPADYAQTLSAAASSGGLADIVQLTGAACGLATAGALAEVPAAVLSLADAPARVFPAALAGHACNGRLYAVPQTVSLPAAGVLVDRAAADAAGLSAAGWATWDALLADARALAVVQDGAMTRAGLHFIDAEALPGLFFALILQNGGQVAANGIVTVNTPQGAAALATLKRFVDEGAVDALRFNEAADPVARSVIEGRSALGVAGPAAVAAWSAARPDAPATYLPLPAGTPAVAAPGWGLAVSSNSAAADVAWDFVRFAALEPANAAAWTQAAGALPALRANGEGDAAQQLAAAQPALGPLLPLLPAAVDLGLGANDDRVWRDITYPRLLAYLQGAATAEATLAGIDADAAIVPSGAAGPP